MAVDHIRSLLHHAHAGHYPVKIRAVDSAGNTVEVVGYVTAIRDGGGIRVCQGDAERGPVHEFAPQRILGIERTHGSWPRDAVTSGRRSRRAGGPIAAAGPGRPLR